MAKAREACDWEERKGRRGGVRECGGGHREGRGGGGGGEGVRGGGWGGQG